MKKNLFAAVAAVAIAALSVSSIACAQGQGSGSRGRNCVVTGVELSALSGGFSPDGGAFNPMLKVHTELGTAGSGCDAVFISETSGPADLQLIEAYMQLLRSAQSTRDLVDISTRVKKLPNGTTVEYLDKVSVHSQPR